jgi:hypothetical protein
MGAGRRHYRLFAVERMRCSMIFSIDFAFNYDWCVTLDSRLIGSDDIGTNFADDVQIQIAGRR